MAYFLFTWCEHKGRDSWDSPENNPHYQYTTVWSECADCREETEISYAEDYGYADYQPIDGPMHEPGDWHDHDHDCVCPQHNR